MSLEMSSLRDDDYPLMDGDTEVGTISVFGRHVRLTMLGRIVLDEDEMVVRAGDFRSGIWGVLSFRLAKDFPVLQAAGTKAQDDTPVLGLAVDTGRLRISDKAAYLFIMPNGRTRQLWTAGDAPTFASDRFRTADPFDAVVA